MRTLERFESEKRQRHHQWTSIQNHVASFKDIMGKNNKK